jgi:5-amino-6-(5-phosphoribosylamino)uracil reductase
MRQLLPFLAEDVVPYEVYRPNEGRDRFLRLNMVASVDGRATDATGLTTALGGEGDRELFRSLRALADGVMVGAGTARAEGYGPHRLRADLAARRREDGRHGPVPIVVVSRALDLDPSTALFAEAKTPTIVVTCAASPAERRMRLEAVTPVIIAGDRQVDLAEALDQLAEQFGVTHVLCEGGPTLNSALLEAGLVDELCLTIAPTITGVYATGIITPPAPAVGLELRGLCDQDGELYARYELKGGANEQRH